jgi:RNA polymerase sigma factor (sigma-70 family)
VTDDYDLLRNFAAKRDVAAFEEVVRRHGPMVWSACRRLLGDHHQAEDAFQAVFLVLMRKAPALVERKPLSHWLHRVVVMVARNAWEKAKRQRARETSAPAMRHDPIAREEAAAMMSDNSIAEYEPILGEEICRLPEKYSSPVILHYFEHKTNEQAAKELGWPKGTFESRLAKAHEILRSRLLQRGVASAGALLATLAGSAHAAVPEALLSSTAHLASHASVASTAAAALSKNVLAGAFTAKLAISAVVVAATVVTGAGYMAVVRSSTPERVGIFAQLPRSDSGQMAKLRALGDDSWIDLGAPAADPQWGKPVGRAWSPMMAYAPDLQGAFLFGQTQNDTNQINRFGDDLWFYHAPSHRWLCVHPGTRTDQADIALNAEGIESTLSGEPMPVATMFNAFCAMTYDTHTKQFVHMPQVEKTYTGGLTEKIAKYQQAGPALARNPSPWFFATMTGKWQRFETASKGPEVGVSIADLLFYLPNKRCYLYHKFGQNADYSYELASNSWSQLPTGHKPPSGSDNIAYFDSRRNRIDLLIGADHWVFDTDTMAWRDIASHGPPAIGWTSTWTYDSANDVGVLISYRHPNETVNGVWIYEPKENSWRKSATPIPVFMGHSNAFYDPQLNAHFIHNAGQLHPGQVFAYRYRADISTR